MPPPFRPHLLVVDDEAPIREALAATLGVDYVVHTVATGQEACAILRAHPIAAIILDAVLGEEHGLNLVEQFRALSSAKILVLTGYGTEELAIRAIRERVDDYLKKPVDLHALHAALEELLVPGGWGANPAVRARRYLDEHLAKPFRARALARQLGVSEGHLRRLFRHAYGKTPRQYLAEARLRRAQELLRSTGLGVDRIAREAGWTSVPTFIRHFRRFYRMTPSRFRASLPTKT